MDVKLPGRGNSLFYGGRPVHLIITMMKWIQTSWLAIKHYLSVVSLAEKSVMQQDFVDKSLYRGTSLIRKQVPVSAYVGSSKNLKDLKERPPPLDRVGSFSNPVLERARRMCSSAVQGPIEKLN